MWLVEKSAARKTCHRLRRITSVHTHQSKRIGGMSIEPPSIISEMSQQAGEALEDQSKSNVTPTYVKSKMEKLGNKLAASS